MKIKPILLVVIVILSITIILVMNSYKSNFLKRKQDNNILTLKEYEGCVAVYSGDRLLEVFRSVNYTSLPEYDKNKLNKGINFNSIEEVYSVIEDFDG